MTIEGRDETFSDQAAKWFDRAAAARLAWTLPRVRRVEIGIMVPADAVGTDGVNSPVA